MIVSNRDMQIQILYPWCNYQIIKEIEGTLLLCI